jgi:hypothetical protein
MQFNKTRKRAEHRLVFTQLSQSLKGRNSEFNSVFLFVAYMTFLLLLIYVAGHYVGISVFMFVLMRWISGERPVFALLVSIGVTVLIYFLFEHGFNFIAATSLICWAARGYFEQETEAGGVITEQSVGLLRTVPPLMT